jgi:hypothetical protein
MPSFNAIYCTDGLTEETINFNGQSIPLGSFITATDPAPAPDVVNYCFQINGGDEISGTLSATSETYSSCYDCLVNNFSKARLNPCSSDYPYDPPLFNLTDFGYILFPGQVFNLEFTIEGRDGTETYSGCFDVEGTLQFSEDDYLSLPTNQIATLSQIFFSNYTSCEECLNGFSAGTESAICNVCYDGSGYTTTTVTAPHPTWTNGQGQAVVQLNAVTLGGPNGLNN